MAKDKKSKEPKKSFIKESKAELKKVNWPKPKRLANDTATVIGIVLIVAIIVFLLDLAFLTLNEQVIIKGEEKIKNSTSNSIVTENNIETTENAESSNDESVTENSDEIVENTNNENTENENQNTETENNTVE